MLQAAQKEFIEILNRQGHQARIVQESTQEDLISSLNDKNVIGVIWHGHNQPSWQKIKDQKVPYNYHLLDAKKRFLSKKIFSNLPPRLQLLGLNTCYTSGVLEKYNLHTFEDPHLLLGGEWEIEEDRENILDSEATNSIAGAINTYRKFNEKGINLEEQTSFQREQEISLTFSFRDLVSSHYDYNILIDGQLRGVLSKKVSDFPWTTVSEKRISINLTAGEHNLVIEPNDPARSSPGIEYPVDNILLDKVVLLQKFKKTALLEKTYNIGDEDRADQETGLFEIRNNPELVTSPFSPSFRLAYSVEEN